MSASSSTAVCISRREVVLSRLAAYFELSKPRIASLVLVVVAVSAFVGSNSDLRLSIWAGTLLGTAFVAASASALNQLIERYSDALMPRTADRPLPAGKLQFSEVLTFGMIALILGIALLAVVVNLQTTAFGLLTWLLYVGAYTPLKARSSANTAVGAVAGALPVLIGWSASGGSLSLDGGPMSTGFRAAGLFLIVYLWQFPHFMAIAWIYRNQYSAAGLKMLTVVDPSGRRAGAQAVFGALALIPISLLPAMQSAGQFYIAGASTLGLAYLVASAIFCWKRDESSARLLLQTSLVYLPALLLLLVLSPFI